MLAQRSSVWSIAHTNRIIAPKQQWRTPLFWYVQSVQLLWKLCLGRIQTWPWRNTHKQQIVIQAIMSRWWRNLSVLSRDAMSCSLSQTKWLASHATKQLASDTGSLQIMLVWSSLELLLLVTSNSLPEPLLVPSFWNFWQGVMAVSAVLPVLKSVLLCATLTSRLTKKRYQLSNPESSRVKLMMKGVCWLTATFHRLVHSCDTLWIRLGRKNCPSLRTLDRITRGSHLMQARMFEHFKQLLLYSLVHSISFKL